MANFLNEHIIMKALARVCRATSRPLTCGYFQVDTDLEDSGGARAQNAAVFSGIGGGFFMVCCAFLWFIVCCCMLCFCGVCVFCGWYVVGFSLHFVFFVGLLLFLCSMLAFVCRKRCWSVFFSRRGEGDNLLDARCDSSEEEVGIAGASEPDRVVVVTGDSGICLVNVFHRHHVVPTPSHARKVLCWITCCSLRCAVRRTTLFLVFSILGIVFPLTTDHLDALSDDWPFGSM